MDQANSILERMAQLYRLKLKTMELQSQIEELEELIFQAQYEQRDADEKLRTYESGSLGALFHKISGKYESNLEEYHRASRLAANKLEQLKRQKQIHESDVLQNQEELTALPDCEAQYALALQTDELDSKQLQVRGAAIKAAFCGKVALHLLEDNKKALLLARSSIKKGVSAGSLHAAYARDQALERADHCANACSEYVRELNQYLPVLEIELMQLGEYFISPTSYIVGAVSEWAWLDRISSALEQIAKGKETLQHVLALLEDVS